MDIASRFETPMLLEGMREGIATFVIQSAAVSPLMLATAGFLGVVAQRATLSFDLTRLKRLMHVALYIALILAIVAGTEISTPKDQNTALILRKVSSIIFVAVYAVFVLVHAYFWIERPNIQLTRRHLLLGISFALPFLGARLAYSVGGAFTPLNSNFSITVGSVELYGLLAVFPEFIVALIYTIFGLTLRLDDDPISGSNSYPMQGDKYPNNGYNAPAQPYRNGNYA